MFWTCLYFRCLHKHSIYLLGKSNPATSYMSIVPHSPLGGKIETTTISQHLIGTTGSMAEVKALDHGWVPSHLSGITLRIRNGFCLLLPKHFLERVAGEQLTFSYDISNVLICLGIKLSSFFFNLSTFLLSARTFE